MATESYLIEDQLDPRSQVALRFYDDCDSRSVEDKIQDSQYLEKLKEEAYRDFAFGWSQSGGSQDLERNYNDLKRVYDLEFSDDLKRTMRRNTNSSELLREAKAAIYVEIQKRIAGKRNRIIQYLYEKNSPIDFSNELLMKEERDITDDDVLNEHKKNPEYWMQKSYEYGVALNQAQIDATPENITLKNAMTYTMNKNHFGKLAEEKAREEVEMMRQNRHQERLNKK